MESAIHITVQFKRAKGVKPMTNLKTGHRSQVTLAIAYLCLAGCSTTAPSNQPDNAIECVDNEPLPVPGSSIPYDTPPVVLKRVDPEYPRLAIAAGLAGDVVVSALVDRCGKVRDAVITKSAEFNGFDDPALSAVRQWRFEPARYRASAVAMWSDVKVEFRLNDSLQTMQRSFWKVD
jgi:TonB family protein